VTGAERLEQLFQAMDNALEFNPETRPDLIGAIAALKGGVFLTAEGAERCAKSLYASGVMADSYGLKKSSAEFYESHALLTLDSERSEQ
jgi:hypothetical protein